MGGRRGHGGDEREIHALLLQTLIGATGVAQVLRERVSRVVVHTPLLGVGGGVDIGGRGAWPAAARGAWTHGGDAPSVLLPFCVPLAASGVQLLLGTARVRMRAVKLLLQTLHVRLHGLPRVKVGVG